MLEICLGYKVASYSHHTESEKWENVFFKLFILLNQIGNEIFLLNTDLWPVSSSSLLLFFTFSLLSLYPHLNFYSVFFFIFLFYFFPFPLLLILFFYATSESGFIFCFSYFRPFCSLHQINDTRLPATAPAAHIAAAQIWIWIVLVLDNSQREQLLRNFDSQ